MVMMVTLVCNFPLPVMYALTLKANRDHRTLISGSIPVNHVYKKLARLTYSVIMAMGALYAHAVIALAVYEVLPNRLSAFITLLCIALSTVNASINAAIFIAYNRQTRVWLAELICSACRMMAGDNGDENTDGNTDQ